MNQQQPPQYLGQPPPQQEWQPTPPQWVPPPPPPPPKKMATWKKWGIGLGALIVVSAVIGQDDTPTSAPSVTAVQDFDADDTAPIEESEEFEVSAADVVDVMVVGDPQVVDTFCTRFDVLGYDSGLEIFTDSYGSGTNPSASEVYDELVSRC